MHEIRSRHRPPLDFLGQRCRSTGGQLEVVCYAHGKVGHEFEVADGEGAQLKGGNGDAMRWFVAVGGAEGG